MISAKFRNPATTIQFNIFARDLPGGKRILIINMRAQQITFNKAIKTVKIFKTVKSFNGFVKSYMLGSHIYYKNSISRVRVVTRKNSLSWRLCR